MKYPNSLKRLISFFQKFPGVGKKTAERFAFQMIFWKQEELLDLSFLIQNLKKKILTCSICGGLYEELLCPFCDTNKRNQQQLCIVSSPKDLFTLETTGIYRGTYQVIPGLLSPMNQIGPKEILLEKIKKRIFDLKAKEVILAFDSTIEGDATALFFKKEFASLKVAISRLAMGMPLGSCLDFLDEETLSKAFVSRYPI